MLNDRPCRTVILGRGEAREMSPSDNLDLPLKARYDLGTARKDRPGVALSWGGRDWD